MSKWTIAALCAFLIFIIGCGNQTANVPIPTKHATPVRTPTSVPANAEEAVRQLINAECEATVQQDIDRLQGIWATDGMVIDARNTPDNTGDDATWKTWDAIRDRYLNVVFPSSPTFCEHPGTTVTFAADNLSATAITGVKIGATNCTDCDKWAFKKVGNDWKISSLTYNLNPQK